MISLRLCLPSKFNLTHLLVGIFLETTAALCRQMAITTDLMDVPQKSIQGFFIWERGKGVWKIGSVACGFSCIKIDYFDSQKV